MIVMQNCANCGTPYDGYACPRCGTPSGINNVQSMNRVCIGCGVQIPASFNNCPHCGRPTGQTPAQPQETYYHPPPPQYPAPQAYPAPIYAPMPPSPPKSGAGKVIIVVAVVIIVIVAAIAAALILMVATNPFNSAREIFDGDIITGKLRTSGTDDLYKIRLDPGEVVTATLSGAGGTDFDLYAYENMFFWDQYIITGSAGETSSEEMNFVAWQDDFYIIDVYSYLGSGDYTLSVDIVEKISLNDGDNSFSDASNIASGNTVTSDLNEYFDQDDYYKIHLNAGQILYAFLKVPVQVSTDFDLYIYDSGGDQLGVSEAAYGNEQLSVYAPDTGFYYVNVWSYDGIGTYTLYVEIQTGPASDTNDDIGTAVATFDGGYITGTLNAYGDVDTDDYYSIPLTAGQTLTATMTGPTDADFDLYLYNNNEAEVANSREFTSYEVIVYTAPISGTYYVNPYAYSGFGTYYLQISTGGSGTALSAVAGNDRTVTTGQSVLFDGRSSTGSITTYTWNFGDGDTAIGSTASHAYDSAGSYIVTLTVTDGSATQSDTLTVTVVSLGSMPDKYALVIGISDYQGDHDLSFCDEDAESWTSYLESQGYTVHTLIDSQASTSKILDEIAWLEEQEEAGDYVAFVFSGHGSYSDRTRSSSICAWNIEEQSGFISDAQLGEAFEDFDSNHMFFFFDSCHSGGMDSVAGSGRYVSQTAGQLEYGLDAPKHEHGMWVYWFLEYAVKKGGNTDLTLAFDVAYPRAVADAAEAGNAMHPEEEFSGISFFL